MSPPSPALAHFLDNGGLSTATIFAGRPFHFHYESVFLKLLIIVDLPSALIEALFALISLPLLTIIHLNTYLTSYFGAGLLLVIATWQWLAVGNTVQNRLVSKPWGEQLVRVLTRYFTAIIVLILLLMIVFVPIVNRRSQRLGFRHPAISFR
jgi:hypothetical protein